MLRGGETREDKDFKQISLHEQTWLRSTYEWEVFVFFLLHSRHFDLLKQE